MQHTTIHISHHTYRHSHVTLNCGWKLEMPVRQLDETGAPSKGKCRHRNDMQTSYRKANRPTGSNLGSPCCETTILTTLTLRLIPIYALEL